jgi:NADH-quinone oxidoreductase subunit C
MPAGPNQLAGERVAAALAAALPGAVVEVHPEWVVVAREQLVESLRWLRDSEEFDAAQLSSLCAVDYHAYFEVVYHLQSLDLNQQIVVKTRTPSRDDASVPSACAVYQGALLQEREAYDLMGVTFDGHPDLRRLFLWEGYPGHPLRKDFLQMPEHHPGLPSFPFEQPGVQAR